MTETKKDQTQNSFAAHFYDEINSVIGGSNPNEKLCLLLPGIDLAKSDFEYDYKNNAPKGPTIEANESRMANKLYDPMDMVNGDNGKTLEHQYRAALDMLTPKLNPIIANAKNQLRELLMKPFPYKFGPQNIKKADLLKEDSGNLIWEKVPVDIDKPESNESQAYTFQEVFFRLYNNYVDQLGEWADQRQRRKEYYTKLANTNPELTTVSQKNKWAENEYLQWYENNGEKWLTAINEKRSVLLAVFSDNDMKIVEGILDSGSGAELQEARQTLNNIRKINPNGGYIYPVKFNPTNWFEYLDTSFTPVDLVNSPTALFNELKLLYSQRNNINTKITEIAAQIPSNETIKSLKKAVERAQNEYIRCDDIMQEASDNSFGDFAKFITVTIYNACRSPEDTAILTTINLTDDIIRNKIQNAAYNFDIQMQNIDSTTISKKLIDSLNIDEKIEDGFEIFFKGGKKVSEAQSKYLSSMNEYTDALLNYTKADSLKNLNLQLSNLNIQKNSLETQIKMLEAKLSRTDNFEEIFSDSTTPPSVPEGFTQFNIVHNNALAESSNFESLSTQNSTSTSGFWTFKSKKIKTKTESELEQLCQNDSTEIEIGMNVTKVGIEREWFNPGIFSLTEEMYNVAEKTNTNQNKESDQVIRISHGIGSGSQKDMETLCHDIFPCYPTAMIIARDVTIKITTHNSEETTSIKKITKEASSSKTFFVFNAGDNSRSYTSSGKSKSENDGRSITIRFTTPQIIGFYLQIIPKDVSQPYPKDTSINNENCIVKFIQAYENVIKKRLETENAD